MRKTKRQTLSAEKDDRRQTLNTDQNDNEKGGKKTISHRIFNYKVHKQENNVYKTKQKTSWRQDRNEKNLWLLKKSF